MFRYGLAFILISILYPSFGLPVQESTPTPIGNKLLDLAKACKNADIAELIKSQNHRCNDTATLTKDLEKCLLFFDINTQLCRIDFPNENFDLKEKYSLNMNQPQNVKTVCKQALAWNFTTIEEYPQYNPGKVFKDEVICVKVCSVEDVLSVDTNFFCKYFMWGSEVLQNLTHETPVINNEAHTITTSKNDKTSSPDIETETSKVIPTVILTSTNNLTNTDVSGQQVVNPQIVVEKPNSSFPVQTAIKNPTESKEQQVKPSTQDKSHDVKPISNDDPNSEIDQEEEEYDTPPDTGDKPIMNSDPNLDPDNSFDQIPPLNNQLLGNNAPLIDTNREFKSSINIGQKVAEIFPNLRQDSQDAFNDDDDNFFPFFITGIVIVVLLYVLYHNKNKLTKVILGLLVEGRQPGKRRNSRGHAYRRLDTLEQAMSSNTAAPPSKIIY